MNLHCIKWVMRSGSFLRNSTLDFFHSSSTDRYRINSPWYPIESSSKPNTKKCKQRRNSNQSFKISRSSKFAQLCQNPRRSLMNLTKRKKKTSLTLNQIRRLSALRPRNKGIWIESKRCKKSRTISKTPLSKGTLYQGARLATLEGVSICARKKHAKTISLESTTSARIAILAGRLHMIMHLNI